MSLDPNATQESPLRLDELAELTHEMRHIWRSISRRAHVGCDSELYQRQQFWVLGVLSTGPKRMSELAELTQTSQASLTGVVDRLEATGLAERIRSSQDRRVVEVAITSVGLDEMRQVQAEIADRLLTLLAPLSPRESRELLRLFRKLGGRDSV